MSDPDIPLIGSPDTKRLNRIPPRQAETLALSVTYDGSAADAVTIEGRPLHIAVSRA